MGRGEGKVAIVSGGGTGIGVAPATRPAALVPLMTGTDAICYAPHGIRLNAVGPGPTRSPAHEAFGMANCVLSLGRTTP